MGFTGYNQGVGRVVFYIPCGGSRGKSVVFLFPASTGFPHSLTHGPLQSSKPTMAGQVFLIWHHSEN